MRELHYFVEKTNDPVTLEVTSYMNAAPQLAFASANADWGRHDLGQGQLQVPY